MRCIARRHQDEAAKLSELPLRFIVAFFAIFLAFPTTTKADIILTLTPDLLVSTPSAGIVFTGQISNSTGLDLNTTDLFLNISGFDPAVLRNVTQLLGFPDLLIPNNTLSPKLDLFSLIVAPSASRGIYSLDVVLQDIFDNSSVMVTGGVSVEGNNPQPVPERASLSLVFIEVVILAALAHLGRKRSDQERLL